MFIPFTRSFSQSLKDFDKYCQKTGFQVEANLISKCEDSRWYLYAGNPVSITVKDRKLKLESGTCFGLQENQNGYKLESDIEGDAPYFISYKEGYVLSRLSTPISRRAQRSAPLKQPEM